MATLLEYFQKDFELMTVDRKLPLVNRETKEAVVTLIGRMHFDFNAMAKFISIYVPKSKNSESLLRDSVGAIEHALAIGDDIEAISTIPGDTPMSSHSLVFTGRIFIYIENEVSDEDREYASNKAKENGHDINIRDLNYAKERAKLEKPLAFISHDSSDKELIAKPLAIALQKLQCPVWYDEFSLKVGMSLREEIEKGLRECKKCIIVLSKNFLSNNGWGKREYDSIFTRELIESQKVILSVWHDVEASDIYEYSPVLADRYGLQWNSEEDADDVSRKLFHAINS